MFNPSSPIPQWYSDAETEQILKANKAALRFWGYDEGEFLRMRATQLLFPEELARQKKLARENRWGETGPWRCRRRNGSELFVKVRWQRMMSDNRLCDFAFIVEAGDTRDSMTPVDKNA
jgi:PAS domain S-box-containing protein